VSPFLQEAPATGHSTEAGECTRGLKGAAGSEVEDQSAVCTAGAAGMATWGAFLCDLACSVQIRGLLKVLTHEPIYQMPRASSVPATERGTTVGPSRRNTPWKQLPPCPDSLPSRS
jgi:hypothetical protein